MTDSYMFGDWVIYDPSTAISSFRNGAHRPTRGMEAGQAISYRRACRLPRRWLYDPARKGMHE